MVEWKTAKIGEFLELKYGKPLPKTHRDPDGEFPVYGANGIKSRTNLSLCNSPSIVVGRKGSAGEVNLTEGEYWPLDVTYYLDFNRDHHDLKFLYYLLTTLNLPNLAKGVKPGINRNEVYDIEVSLPPLPEQKRIVAILDEAFAAIEKAKANAERNLENARELFEGYLKELFQSKKKGWKDKQLSELCREVTVGHVGPMKKEYKSSGIPFLRSQNVRPFCIDLTDVRYISLAFDQSLKKSRLEPGDLAIVRTGYPGTAAVIPPNIKQANCSDLVIVRPGNEVSPYFLEAFFNSNFGKSIVLGNLTGAAQKHFNVTAAKQVTIHLPAIKEQATLVERISEFRTKALCAEKLYRKKVSQIDNLKQSLLHKAFSGELN